MAVQQGHGKMAGANSLVFAYDTGDTVNSYKGEPTENLITGNMNTSGAASLGSDAGGNYIQLGNNTSSYAAIVVPNIYIPSGVTYTWSFELKSSETFTSNFSWDTNEYSDQYPNSNDNSRLTYNHSTPTMVANEWTQYRLTVVMKDGLTNARSGDFFRFFFPTFQNKKIYYRNVQFELKDHITSYAGLGGTRSATEGLKDLKGNIDIDLSNVSFDANAEMTFDGTDDKIVIPADSFSNIGTSNFTVELVFKNTKTSNYSHFFSVKDQYHFALKMSNTGDRNIYVYRNSALSTHNVISAYAPSSTDYYHLVCKREGDNLELYLNGVSKGTKSGWNSIDIENDTYATSIGTHGTSSEFTGGEIPVVKLYNKALTAAEVQANFNNYKTRFNIS